MICHYVEQGSPDWFAMREGIPTATDFKEIVTAVKGDLSASSEALINRLIDQCVRPGSQECFYGNRHTERGHALEPEARAWYSFVTGARVELVGFVTRDDGRAGCSPDGFAYALAREDLHPLASLVSGLEIKCPDGPTHVAYLRAKALPNEYRQQIHGSMVITGLPAWDFVSFCPGYEPMMLRVEWDDYTDKCAKALEQFLTRFDAAKRELGLLEEV
jgi:hypothetical protein